MTTSEMRCERRSAVQVTGKTTTTKTHSHINNCHKVPCCLNVPLMSPASAKCCWRTQKFHQSTWKSYRHIAECKTGYHHWQPGFKHCLMKNSTRTHNNNKLCHWNILLLRKNEVSKDLLIFTLFYPLIVASGNGFVCAKVRSS